VNAPLPDHEPRRDPNASRADDPTYQGADERTRQLGLALVPKLSAVLRVSRSYEPENQVFRQQLAQLIGVVRPLLEEHAEAVLVALDDDLYLNGVRIPVDAHGLRFHRHVFEELKRRRIAGLRLMRGITPHDLGVLFKLFRDPDVHHGAELLRACLAEGADHLQPVVHATTDTPDDDFEYDHEEGAAEGGSRPGPGPAGAGPAPSAAETGADDGHGPVGGRPTRGAARKTYANAVQGARALLMTTTLQGGMALRHAKRVVQPLVDAACSDAPVVMGLHTLTHHDETAYVHAVNVTLVAVTMGRLLELDRHELADLGVAALLHDVGKQAVAGQVRHPFDRYDENDWAAIRRHPIEGLKTIARSGAMSATTLRCMRVAFEHHMGPGPGGYPEMSQPWQTSLWSRMVSVADAFVSLQTHRSARGAGLTPYMALGMMLGPMRERFDPSLLWVLVQSVGFYPPGQLVELDDRSIAIVLAPHPEDPARPHVRVLMDPQGVNASGEPVELHPVPGDRSIRRALPPEEYPAEPLAAAA
jgi:HD-GYP domain-containing protein (c-di-GMP phosphodiesterase class II)